MTTAAPLWGIDTSGHRPGTNNAAFWRSAAKQGYTFGSAKFTEGTYFVEPTGPTNVTYMAAAGLIPGAFHFQAPGHGAAQCDFFISHLPGKSPNGLWCCLDVEAGSYADTVAFVNRWRQLTTQPLVIYSGNWFWSGGLHNPAGKTLTPYLWDSVYVYSNTKHPEFGSVAYANGGASKWRPLYGGWSATTFLQFTDSGTITGWGGAPLDLDAFAGTTDDLLSLTKESPVPVPAPAPPPTPKQPDPVPASSIGGVNTSDPSSAWINPTTYMVVARGTTDRLYSRRWTAKAGWDRWRRVSMDQAAGAPHLTVSPDFHRLDLVFVGVDQQLMHLTSTDGHVWTGER